MRSPNSGCARLDPAPIVEALEAYMRRRPDRSWADLAEDAGTSERALLRYRSGESAHVTLDAADRISMALGLRLDDLYPLVEEEGTV